MLDAQSRKVPKNAHNQFEGYQAMENQRKNGEESGKVSWERAYYA